MLRAMADQVLSIDGSISSRSEGLRKRIDLNQDRQDMLEDRIAQVEKRLRAQYTALDRQMASLQQPVELRHAAAQRDEPEQQPELTACPRRAMGRCQRGCTPSRGGDSRRRAGRDASLSAVALRTTALRCSQPRPWRRTRYALSRCARTDAPSQMIEARCARGPAAALLGAHRRSRPAAAPASRHRSWCSSQVQWLAKRGPDRRDALRRRGTQPRSRAQRASSS